MSEPLIQRAEFRYFHQLTTNWQDNDLHGHIGHARFYGFFDSAIQALLVREGGLDIHEGAAVGVMVSSSCDCLGTVAFPDVLEVGLKVERLGASSVEYRLAVFRVGDEEAAVTGRCVQIFLDRHTSQPVALAPAVRQALSQLA